MEYEKQDRDMPHIDQKVLVSCYSWSKRSLRIVVLPNIFNLFPLDVLGLVPQKLLSVRVLVGRRGLEDSREDL